MSVEGLNNHLEASRDEQLADLDGDTLVLTGYRRWLNQLPNSTVELLAKVFENKEELEAKYGISLHFELFPRVAVDVAEGRGALEVATVADMNDFVGKLRELKDGFKHRLTSISFGQGHAKRDWVLESGFRNKLVNKKPEPSSRAIDQGSDFEGFSDEALELARSMVDAVNGTLGSDHAELNPRDDEKGAGDYWCNYLGRKLYTLLGDDSLFVHLALIVSLEAAEELWSKNETYNKQYHSAEDIHRFELESAYQAFEVMLDVWCKAKYENTDSSSSS